MMPAADDSSGCHPERSEGSDTPTILRRLNGLLRLPSMNMSRRYYVYILANDRGTIYTGVTNDLQSRVSEHKARQVPGFTARYGINKLVFFEVTSNVYAALAREKQIKSWTRAERLALIASLNPEWDDLSAAWTTHPIPRCARDDK